MIFDSAEVYNDLIQRNPELVADMSEVYKDLSAMWDSEILQIIRPYLASSSNLVYGRVLCDMTGNELSMLILEYTILKNRDKYPDLYKDICRVYDQVQEYQLESNRSKWVNPLVVYMAPASNGMRYYMYRCGMFSPCLGKHFTRHIAGDFVRALNELNSSNALFSQEDIRQFMEDCDREMIAPNPENYQKCELSDLIQATGTAPKEVPVPDKDILDGLRAISKED